MKKSIENNGMGKNLVDQNEKFESTKMVDQNNEVDQVKSRNIEQNQNIDISKKNFTIPDLVNLLGKSKQALYKRFVKKEGSAIMSKNGKKTMWEIPFSALKESEKIKVLEAMNLKNDSTNNLDKIETEKSLISVSDYEYQLPEKQLKIAISRRNLVVAYVAYLATKKGNKIEAKKEFEETYNTGLPLPKIFEVLGKTSYKTIERWKVNYLKSNKDYRVLAPKYKLKIGLNLSEQEKQILLGYALQPNQPLKSEVVRAAKAKFIMLNLKNIRSEDTYRRFLDQWEKENFDKWVFAREGEKALNDKCIPDVIRDYSKIEVGDIIVADGHVLNFEILNPFTGKLKRMTWILFYDMKSNTPLGWEIQPTENVRSIAIALYRTILRLGKYPKVIYLDNGKAFRAKYFNGEDIENSVLPGLFDRIGVKVIYAKPYHAQSKTIERFFRTFAELERMMPTYSGTSIAKKPPRMIRGEKLQRSIYAKVTKNRTIDLWTANSAIAAWIDEYMMRPQQGHLKNLAPIDLFEVGKGAGVDKRELIFLMMEDKIATLYKNGILFGKTWYWHDEFYGLRMDNKTKLVIKYDLIEKDRIYVYSQEGNFICEAIETLGNHPAANILGTEEDVKQLDEALRKKGLLKKGTTAGAKEFLSEEMSADIGRQIHEAKVLQLKEAAKNGEAVPKKKKKSAFDEIDEADFKEVKNKSSFWDEAAEG